MSDLQAYTLCKEDIERAREAGGPLAALPDLSGVRENMAVVVVEKAGRIVGYWCLFYALHAEPLEIVPEERGNPAVGRALVGAMLEEARKTGEGKVFCIIDTPTVEDLGAKLGFAPIPGRMWEMPLSS